MDYRAGDHSNGIPGRCIYSWLVVGQSVAAGLAYGGE